MVVLVTVCVMVVSG